MKLFLNISLLSLLLSTPAVFATPEEKGMPHLARFATDVGNDEYISTSAEVQVPLETSTALQGLGRYTTSTEGNQWDGEAGFLLQEPKTAEGKITVLGRSGPRGISATGVAVGGTIWLSSPADALTSLLTLDSGLTFYRLPNGGPRPMPLQQILLAAGLTQDLTSSFSLGVSFALYLYNLPGGALGPRPRRENLSPNRTLALSGGYPDNWIQLKATWLLTEQISAESSVSTTRMEFSPGRQLGLELKGRYQWIDGFTTALKANAMQQDSTRQAYDRSVGVEAELVW